jgi:hypothetical protein
MNRYLAMLLFVTGVAFAVSDDGGDVTGPQAALPNGGTDDIVVTVLNTWSPTYASHVLDVEYRESDDAVLFISSLNNTVFIADADNGAQLGSVARPAGIVGFGVTWINGEYFINAWNNSNMYHGSGSGWTSFSNPAGTAGRGLSYDGEKIWQSNSQAAQYMNPDGTGATAVPLSGITYQISGLATYPLTTGDRMPCGLIATCYNESPPKFHFYTFDGGSATLLGVVNCPGSPTGSYGIAFAQARGTFFWAYLDGSGYHVSELSITGLTPLDRDTWAGIKSLF